MALWKTQGLTIEPWRADIRFGAVEHRGMLCVTLTADRPWSGRLIFDKPRHKVNLHLPIDYPRLNQFPEWFTAKAANRYTVHNISAGSENTFTGEQLQDGIPIEPAPGKELRLAVRPADR